MYRKTLLIIIAIVVAIMTPVRADKVIIGDNSEFIIYGIPYIHSLVENDIQYVHQYGAAGTPMYLCFESACSKEDIVILNNNNIIIDASNIDLYKSGALYCFPSNDLVPADTDTFTTLTFKCGQNFEKSISFTRTYLDAYDYELQFPDDVKIIKEETDPLFRIPAYYLNVTPNTDVEVLLKLWDSDNYLVDTSQFATRKGEMINIYNGNFNTIGVDLCQPQATCVTSELPISTDNSVYKNYYINLVLSKYNTFPKETTFSLAFRIIPRPLDIKLKINDQIYEGEGLFVGGEKTKFLVEPVIYSGDVSEINTITLTFYKEDQELESHQLTPNNAIEINIPDTGMEGKIKITIDHKNGGEYVFEYPFRTFNIQGIMELEKQTYYPGNNLKGNISIKEISYLSPTIKNMTILDSENKVVSSNPVLSIGDNVINFTFHLPYTLQPGTYKVFLNLSVTYNNKELYSTDEKEFEILSYGDTYIVSIKCDEASPGCNTEEDDAGEISFGSILEEKTLTFHAFSVGKKFNDTDIVAYVNKTKVPEADIKLNVSGEIEPGTSFKIEVILVPVNYFGNKADPTFITLKIKIKDNELYSRDFKIKFEESAQPIDLVFTNKKDSYKTDELLTFTIENAPLTLHNINATFRFNTNKGSKEIIKEVTSKTISVEIPKEVLVSGTNKVTIIASLYYDKNLILTKEFSIEVTIPSPSHYKEMLDRLEKACNCSNAPTGKCEEYAQVIKEKKSNLEPIPDEIYEFINSAKCDTDNQQGKEPTLDEMKKLFEDTYKELCISYKDEVINAYPDKEKEITDICNTYETLYSLEDIPDEELKNAYETLQAYAPYINAVKQGDVNPQTSPNEESKNTILIIGIIIAVISVIGVAIAIYKAIPHDSYDDYEIEEDI